MAEISPLGRLPDGWKLAKLDDLTTKIGSGATPRGGEKTYLERRQNYALVRSQCVHDRWLDIGALSYISDEQATGLKNVELQSEDILINITGDGATFSRCCLVPKQILPACVNQHVAIIRPELGKLEPGYLLCFLSHPTTKAYIESFNAGGSRRAITKGHIESFEIPLPPLKAQRQIAELFGVLDDKIELNRRMNETLEAMARAIFKDWFVDFGPTRTKMAMRGEDPGKENVATAPYLAEDLWSLFPDSVDDEAKPQGWRIGNVADIAEKIQNGGTPKRSEERYWVDGTVPWLTSGEVRQDIIVGTQNFITEAGLQGSSAKMLPEKAILIALYGATAGQVAFCAVPLSTNQAISAVVPQEGYRYFLLMHLKGAVEKLANSAVGSAQQNISKKIVEDLGALYPSKNCAQAFDHVAGPLFDRAIANLRENQALAKTRDLLLPKLMSGEIRIHEAEEIIEEVA